ncbi:hypothetical protein JCM10212_000081 [Sporobolomyces blumeae]
MSWLRSSDYVPLPTSTVPSSPNPAYPAQTSSSPSSSSSSRARTNRAIYLVGGCAFLVMLCSLWVVPEDKLPSSVSTAVGASREAFEAAKGNLGWSNPGEFDNVVGTGSGRHGEDVGGDSFEPEWWDGAVATEEVGGDLDHDVLLPLTASGDPVDGTGEEDDVLVVEEMIVCSDAIRAKLGEASFWIVKSKPDTINSRSFSIEPRNPLSSDVPSGCLSQSVFSARLVASTSADSLELSPDSEILHALPAPTLSDSLASYDVAIPADLRVPSTRYELEVTLEFGFYPGVVEGTCGDGVKVCHEEAVSVEHGEQLRYLGNRIEVQEEDRFLEVGTALANETDLALCDDLSSLDGYWSNLTYYPTSPSPCAFFTPAFPLPFVAPASDTARKVPIWIHFVGDSNTRNLNSHLLNSFGNGHKLSAAKVVDSPTHNGTHASFASRYRMGEIPNLKAGQDDVPDLIVTWSWWYQSTPLPVESRSQQEQDEAWSANLDANRADLLRLVDTTLADYLPYANLATATKSSRTLAEIAKTLRPHRTYLSLGSHSEGLSVPGSIASLAALFDPIDGLSKARREASNVRLFTTTLVNPTYIPLDRFPHQDLVRNNAFISAKNAYARSMPELVDERRIINVEALTDGITVDGAWMKPGRNGRSPDAVHFRDEVYDEWVRLVWTDLVKGTSATNDVIQEGLDEARKRWKRRIADWADQEEDD